MKLQDLLSNHLRYQSKSQRFSLLSSFAAKFAATVPWNGSINDVRNTYSFTSPSSFTVTVGLVPDGLISGVLFSFAISACATVAPLVAAPMIATTLSCVY